jgi:hypothetical protein
MGNGDSEALARAGSVVGKDLRDREGCFDGESDVAKDEDELLLQQHRDHSMGIQALRYLPVRVRLLPGFPVLFPLHEPDRWLARI